MHGAWRRRVETVAKRWAYAAQSDVPAYGDCGYLKAKEGLR